EANGNLAATPRHEQAAAYPGWCPAGRRPGTGRRRRGPVPRDPQPERIPLRRLNPTMHPDRPHVPRLSSRRDFLCKACGGFGALALSYLFAGAGFAGPAEPLAGRPAQFTAKARSVIFLFMEGGPSHLDTLDPKPELTRLHGEKLPASFGTVITA